jgi:hypothetical protein
MDRARLLATRQAQVVTALNRAVTLQPSLWRAHQLLTQLYSQLNYQDLALEHQQETVKYLRSWGQRPHRGPTESATAYDARLKADDDRLKYEEAKLKLLQAEVDRRRRDYRLSAANRSLQAKIAAALYDEYQDSTQPRWNPRLGRGLVGEALKLLLNAKPAELDQSMGVLQVKLLLTTGRSQEVRGRLPALTRVLNELNERVKKNPQLLRNKADLERSLAWLQALQAAANGDYRRADEAVARLEDMEAAGIPRKMLENQARALITHTIYAYTLRQQKILGPPLRGYLNNIMGTLKMNIVYALRREAEMQLIRGLLALEQGDTARAAALFHQVIRVSQDLSGGTTNYTDRFVAARYLHAIQKPGLPVLSASLVGLTAAPPGKGGLLFYGALFPGNAELAASALAPGSTASVAAAFFDPYTQKAITK